MKDKVYLLDTNIFTEPYRTFYSFDYGTAFWDFFKIPSDKWSNIQH